MESGNKTIPQQTVKLTLIGMSKSGKTLLADVILEDKVRFATKKNSREDKHSATFANYLEGLNPAVNLEVNDYSADELSRSALDDCYEGVDLALFTLDMSQDNFKEQAAFLVEEHKRLLEKRPEAICYLALTQSNRPKKISEEQVEELKKQLGISHHFTSAFRLKKGILQESESITQIQHYVREAVKPILAKRPVYQNEEKLKTSPFQNFPASSVNPAPRSDLIVNIVVPKQVGKLTESQQNLNLRELKAFHLKKENAGLLQVSKDQAAKFEELIKALWVACGEKEIVLNSDLRPGMLPLFELLKKALAQADLQLDAFQKAALEWAETYKRLEIQAAQAARHMANSQERGILRGLKDFGRIPPAIWCEDLDLRECLKGVMVTPEEIKAEGTYVLPPISLATSDLIKSCMQTVMKKKIENPVDLWIPNQTGNHWRCAHVRITGGAVVAATLWDSYGDRNLSAHYSYVNFQKAITMAQAAEKIKNKVIIVPEPAGIQTNGWSCGDYVLQKSLKAFNGELDPQLQAIRDADPRDPIALRTVIINRILGLNPLLKDKYKPESLVPPAAPSYPPYGWPSPQPSSSQSSSFLSAFSDNRSPALPSFFQNRSGQRGDPSIADGTFLTLRELIETWVSSEPDETLKKPRNRYFDAISALDKKVHSDCEVGRMTTAASVYAAERAEDLTKKVIAGTVTPLDISDFQNQMMNMSSNYSWRVIVGAVIGAAVGIVIGAMIAIMAGPLAAVAALFVAAQAAVLGAAFFGTLGMAVGTGLGIWRTIQNDPVIEVGNAAEACRPRIPVGQFFGQPLLPIPSPSPSPSPSPIPSPVPS